MNLQKSRLIFGQKVPGPLQVQISQILGIPRWKEPRKYLGIPAQ